MRSLCTNIITGNNVIQSVETKCDLQVATRRFTYSIGCSVFSFSSCMRYITVLLKLSLTFKIYIFFNIPLIFFPKYYIISLSGDDCLKMKEAKHSERISSDLSSKTEFGLFTLKERKNKKKTRRKEKTCSFSGTSAILGEFVIDPDGGCSRRDHSSENEDAVRRRECVLQAWSGEKTTE